MAQFEISLASNEAEQFDLMFWRFVTAELSDKPTISTRLTSCAICDGVEHRVVKISDEHQLSAFRRYWNTGRR